MAYAPMYETWRIRAEDGYLYDIVLDLGRGEDYPLKTHPWFFAVRIPMADRKDSGLPTEGEAVRLDTVENRIREVLRGREAIYVGRRTGNSNRDLIFYLPERPRGVEDRLRASVGMETLFISRPDPKWEAYEQLLPGPREWRQIEDIKGVNALLNADADPERVHRVEHRVETTSAKGAEALAKLFEKLELKDVAVDKEPTGHVISGVQETPLLIDSIHRVSWILDSKAGKARGTYLGWTADPEIADEPREPSDAFADLEAALAGFGLGDDDDEDDES